MSEFKRTTVYLIIRADRYMRLGKRLPRLADDEVAVRLNIAFPATWGRVLTDQDVTISLPDFTPTVATSLPQMMLRPPGDPGPGDDDDQPPTEP